MKKAEERERVICPLAEQLVLISPSFESKSKSNVAVLKDTARNRCHEPTLFKLVTEGGENIDVFNL